MQRYSFYWFNEKMKDKSLCFLMFFRDMERKNAFRIKKVRKKIWSVNKKPYLCIVKNGTGGSVESLDYGVMVTQQILVLFFQVRVLVVQQALG